MTFKLTYSVYRSTNSPSPSKEAISKEINWLRNGSIVRSENISKPTERRLKATG